MTLLLCILTSMKEIVQKGDAVLREIAQEVPREDITNDSIQAVVKEMKEALLSQDDGVAIAAPQIGYSLRIFVVSHKVFPDRKELGTEGDMVFINPEIVNTSKKKEVMEEGCLSVRWWYGKVERSVKATVKALNEHGEPFTYGGSGLLAQIFQHEIDHLHGVLFVDKATDLREFDEKSLDK